MRPFFFFVVQLGFCTLPENSYGSQTVEVWDDVFPFPLEKVLRFHVNLPGCVGFIYLASLYDLFGMVT